MPFKQSEKGVKLKMRILIIEDEFKIADASHELKTPITVIMANAEALENDPNEKKWVDNIRSESERIN